MSIRLCCFFALTLTPTITWAQGFAALDSIRETQNAIDLSGLVEPLTAEPDVNPSRIINESFNFRKEREPDMTAAEFALYERLSGMVETNAAFALQLLETMLGDDDDDSAAFDLALGNLYYAESRMDEALARYESSVEKYPEFLRGWVNIAMIHYQRKNFSQAATAYAKAINLGDRDAQTFGLLAFCMRQTGNTIGAEAAFMQAMTASPEDTNWIGGLLELYFVNQRHAQAEPLIRELVRLDPSKSENWMLYASLLTTLDRPLEAATQLEIARRLGVAQPNALALLGDLYVGLGFIPEAIAVYESFPAGSSDLGTERLITYARSLVYKGDLEQARRILGKIPASSQWEIAKPRYFALAELATAEENWEDAQFAFQGILQKEPLNPFALLGAGSVFEQAGDTARAEFTFDFALQVPESEHRASLELANIALLQSNFERAVHFLNRADSLEPSSAIRNQVARINALATP
jgi:tetratricopeptide (TPR) repeat protein